MPTYSYRCTECGTAFDIHQAFSDDSLTECPTCGGKLRKVFNAIGVSFNGSGFYRTDSRAAAKDSSSPAKNPAKAPAKDAPAAPKKEATSGSGASTSSSSSSSSGSTSS